MTEAASAARVDAGEKHPDDHPPDGNSLGMGVENKGTREMGASKVAGWVSVAAGDVEGEMLDAGTGCALDIAVLSPEAQPAVQPVVKPAAQPAAALEQQNGQRAGQIVDSFGHPATSKGSALELSGSALEHALEKVGPSILRSADLIHTPALLCCAQRGS